VFWDVTIQSFTYCLFVCLQAILIKKLTNDMMSIGDELNF